MLCRILLFFDTNRLTHNSQISLSVPVKSYDFPVNDSDPKIMGQLTSLMILIKLSKERRHKQNKIKQSTISTGA